MTNKVIYSHRPKAGISVGATNNGEYLDVAFSLVNDGLSSNGLFWKERRDNFSRKTARAIINGRLEALNNGTSSNFAIRFETSLNAREFMRSFRESFKPTVNELDEVFCEYYDDFMHRKSPTAIFDKVCNMINDVVSQHNMSEVPF